MQRGWVVLVVVGILGSLGVCKRVMKGFSGQKEIEIRKEILEGLMEDAVLEDLLTLQWEENRGIFVQATSNIPSSKDTMKIPSELVFSVYNEFPFKDILIDPIYDTFDKKKFYQEVPLNKNDREKVLTTIEMLININVDREVINKRFPKYKKTSLYIEGCSKCEDYFLSLPTIDSFNHLAFWSQQEIDMFKEITFSEPKVKNISSFYHELLRELKSLNTQESLFIIEEVLSDKEQFKWAFNIIETRCFDFEAKNYNSTFSELATDQENQRLNKKLGLTRLHLLLPIFDILNMIVPTEKDYQKIQYHMNSKTQYLSFFFDKKPGFLYLSIGGDFIAGEEYGFAYTQDFSCANLISRYGFMAPEGILEEVKIAIPNELPKNVLTLCKLLRCTGAKPNSPVSDNLKYKLTLTEFMREQEQFLNYFRIKHFHNVPSNPSTQTLKALAKKIKRNFTKFSYITFTNEIMAITDALDVLSFIATSRNFTVPGDVVSLSDETECSALGVNLQDHCSDQMKYREKIIYSCAISQHNIIFKHIAYLHSKLNKLLVREF
ncbi:unnamed protein product [Moneuplotes crassus]|uniref:Uncharacterized protein n=1 Tax=Euplotes crassus TaxID=5936 RepID=A0AAD1X243_EUPCR|nr:unnamed protein product [Moneuplotes crassus]